jgi:general secretion pathway protein J
MTAACTARSRRDAAGMTLLEILVSLAILAMMSLLIYGAFDSMNRGIKGEELRSERGREGRDGLLRISRELTSAFLSMHNPKAIALITRQVAFMGQHSSPYDRVDFAAFAHRRIVKDSHESDQAEVGYSAQSDPDAPDKMDLVRREQTPIDQDPVRGGVVNVLVENIDLFSLKYLDAQTGIWQDTWDSTLVNAQYNRLPLEIKIAITLRGRPGLDAQTFTTKIILPMLTPLSFGIPR